MLIHNPKRNIRKTTMTLAALGLVASIRRDASRTFVRAAFAPAYGNINAGRKTGSTAAFTNSNNRNYNSFSNSNYVASHRLGRVAMSTSTDEELDAALEDILGEAMRETQADDSELENSLDEILGEVLKEADDPEAEHIEGSQPIAKDLIEQEVEEDFSDPKFLSTSNPHWNRSGVPQDIIDILSGKGITHFTPVQAKAIRPVIAGRDVIGRSRTGTGKTLAFGIPSMLRIIEKAKANGNAEVMRDGSIRIRRGRLPL